MDGATEATFDLTFSTASPGSIRFVVLYAQMYARFVDTYLVFDNTVSGSMRVVLAATCQQCLCVYACFIMRRASVGPEN